MSAESYEDRVARLLAEVADLLLAGNRDWLALERLTQALRPNPTTGLSVLTGSQFEADREAVRHVLDPTRVVRFERFYPGTGPTTWSAT